MMSLILNDTFGASYFEWDGGNPGRMILFARVAAIANFVRANEDVELINSKFIRDLPAWPNLDSIQLSNENILIVKLSKEMSETHSNRFFEEIKIQPYDVTHLNIDESPYKFYLDTCQKTKDRYRFSGWATLHSGSTKTDIVIKRNEQFYKVETYTNSRKDVTTHLNNLLSNVTNYDYSGFSGQVALKQLGDEFFEVYLHLYSNDSGQLIKTSCIMNASENP